MTHKAIKKFPMKGIINDDSDFARLRAQYEALMIDMMRGEGYVPVLEIGPLFSTKMRKDGKYDFELSLYGVYVNKEKAWKTEGMDGDGKFLPRSPKSKWRPSSTSAE